MSFAWLERIADEKLREAERRGEFDHLPGAGKPLPDEGDLVRVAPELRLVYRVLKNAGYVPEEVSLRWQIEDVARLLDLVEEESPDYLAGRVRLRRLMERPGELRGGNLALHERYLREIAERFAGSRHRRASPA